ncbi:unnamed protein product [Staurois parvus]|uniref:Uncharacterized protein n=1 Tax=Staurois parvus TaxID=386267 RepID=A0ABN9EQR2_9NEOB|nr:unnamed protein product [Staurois parvus]
MTLGSTPADRRYLPWSQVETRPAVCEGHNLGRVCRRQTSNCVQARRLNLCWYCLMVDTPAWEAFLLNFFF